MNNIKFRFWYQSQKKMSATYSLFQIASAKGPSTLVIDDGNTTPLRFTGLADKNGRDIYEGDIVQWPSHDKPLCVQYVDNAAQFVFTQDINDQDAFSIRLLADRQKRLEALGLIQVIGNVYENPELLNA
jgi:uncharacterized phage protein (TIGR01671 family)